MTLCVNTNSKEFKTLLSRVNVNAMELASKVSTWQNTNYTNRFPTPQQLGLDVVPVDNKVINRVLTYIHNTYNPNSKGFFSKKAANDLGSIRSLLRDNGLIDAGYNILQADNGAPYLVRNGNKIITKATKLSKEINFNNAQDHINNNSEVAQRAYEIAGVEKGQIESTSNTLKGLKKGDNLTIVFTIGDKTIKSNVEVVDFMNQGKNLDYGGIEEILEIKLRNTKNNKIYIVETTFDGIVKSQYFDGKTIENPDTSLLRQSTELSTKEEKHNPYAPTDDQIANVEQLIQDFIDETGNHDVTSFNEWYKRKTLYNTDTNLSEVFAAANPSSKFDFTTVDHSNRLMSYVAYKLINQLKKITYKNVLENDTSIRDLLINTLEKNVNSTINKLEGTDSAFSDQQLDNIRRIIDDFKNKDGELWDRFINYFSAVYKFNITDPYELLAEKGIAELPTHWEDTTQLKEDKRDTISSKIKFFLSSMAIGINPITNMPELVQLDAILNRLISAHQFDSTPSEYINTIKTLEKEYPHIYTHFQKHMNITEQIEGNSIKYKIGDMNMFNAYINALNYHMPEVFAIVTSEAYDLTIMDALTSNRNSFVKHRDFDIWLDNININYKKGNLDFLYNRYKEFINNWGASIVPTIDNMYLSNFTGYVGDPYTMDYFNALARVLNEVGVTIAADTMFTEYHSTKYSKNPSLFVKEWIDPSLRLLRDIVINLDNKFNATDKQTKSLYSSYRSDQKGTLQTLARVNAKYSPTKAQLDYLNVNNDTVYTPIYQSAIGRFSKALNSISYAVEFFEGYAKDKRNQYSNILWNVNGKGILNYDKKIFKTSGVKQIDKSNPLNIAYTTKLSINMFNGMKLRTKGTGLEYSDLISKSWMSTSFLAFLEGNHIIPSSDAGRTFALNWAITDRTNNSEIDTARSKELNYNEDTGKYTINEDGNLFNMVKNTILQEASEMKRMADKLFIIEGNTITPNPYYENNYDNLLKLHNPKHWDGNSLVDDNTGLPTGRMFTFNNLTYVKDGKLVRLNDYFENLNYLTEDISSAIVDSTINKFISDAINSNLEKHISEFVPLANTLMNQVDYNRTQGFSEKARSFTKDKLETNKIFKSYSSLNRELAHFYIENYIAQLEINNLFSGTADEYKGTNDQNKRVSQLIKNGISTLSNRRYRSLVINDINRNSVFTSLISKLTSKENADNYNGINSADGITFITIDEFKKRAEEFGRLDELEAIIKVLEDPSQPFDFSKYVRLLESQKYFYYNREYDEATGSMISTQYKNSTIVLTPRLTKLLQLEELNRFMNINKLDEVAVDSARKIGGSTAFKLVDNNGNFINTDINPIPYSRTLSMKGLLIQLDVKAHTLDTVNKSGIQLEKQIIQNTSSNAIYSLDGVSNKLTGKEIQEHFHQLKSVNIKDSAISLLKRFDAVENNEIKYDENGHIDINKTKLLDYIRDYVNKNETNQTLRQALGIKGSNFTNIALYSGMTYKKFESIMLALYTNNVTNQKMPGLHVPIAPEFGLGLSFDNTWESYFNDPHRAVDYIDEVKNQLLKGERDHKLQIKEKKDSNNETYYIIEAILPPWMKEFYQAGQLMDINLLSEDSRTMFGMRIPTEGKQSMVYVEAIGWHKTAASQAIFPFEMVTKTGWDFDIDTIYLYYKKLQRTEEGGYDTIKYLDDNNSTVEERYETFLLSTPEAANARLKYANEYKKALEKLNNSYKWFTGRINSLVNDESLQAYIDLLHAKYEIHEQLRQLDSDEINFDVTLYDLKEPLLQQLNDLKLQEVKLLKLYGEDQLKERYKKYKDTKGRKRERISELRSDYISTKNAYLNMVRDEAAINYPIDYFKGLTVEEQNTRDARNARIIDIYASVVKNQHHANEYWKPNSMDNIKAASNFVNNLFDYNVDTLNMNNMLDYSKIRDLNMSTRILKGNSVAWDGIMAILGFTNAELNSNNSLVFKVKADDKFFTKYNKDKFNKLFKNVTKDPDGNYLIDVTHFANSKDGNWMDVNDTNINTQASEVTANILDAVKVIMGFNLNETTLPVFRLLSSTSMSFILDGKPNRFIVPYLFIHQPAIIDIADRIAIEKVENPFIDFKTVKNDLIREYDAKVVNLILDDITVKDKEIGKSIKKKLSIYKTPYFSRDERSIISDVLSNITNLPAEYDSNIIPDGQTLIDNINNSKNYELLNKIDKIKYLTSQLEVLNTYDHVNNSAGSIIKSITTFNTDKVGTGPTFNTTRKLINNVMDLYINRDALLTYSKNKNSNVSPEEVRDLFAMLDTLSDPNDIITQYKNFLNNREIDSLFFTPLLIEGIPAVEKIYPSLFNRNIKSSYPTLEAFIKYANIASSDTFMSLFPHEYGSWYALKKRLLSNTKLLGNEYYESLVNDYINSYHTNKSNFFNATNNELLLNAVIKFEEQHNVGFDIRYLEKKQIFGPLADEIMDINLKNPNKEDRNKFLRSSLVTKLTILKSNELYRRYLDNFKGTHIIDNITLLADSNTHNKFGYSTFKINRTADPELIKESFTDMFNSKHELIRVTAEEMIKSHNYLFGMHFGNNISQYIDIKLLYNNEASSIKERIDLSDFDAHLRKVEDSNIYGDIEENFIKANWSDSRLVKEAKPKIKGISPNDFIDTTKPTFNLFLNKIEGIDTHPIGHVIKESVTKVDESIYANDKYIKKKVGDDMVLYKRYMSNMDPTSYYYYPINRLLPNETEGISGITRYNKFPIKDPNIKLTDESDPQDAYRYLYTEEAYISAIEAGTENDIYRKIEDKSTILSHVKNSKISNIGYTKKSVDINSFDSNTEVIYPFEGSTIEYLSKLNPTTSIYIGDKSDILSGIANNTTDLSNVNNVFNILNKESKKAGRDVDILLLGKDTYNEQEYINLHKSLDKLLAYNPDKYFRIHVLNTPGISNALRKIHNDFEVIVHAHDKSKNTVDINEDVDSKINLDDYSILVDKASYEDISYIDSQIKLILNSLHKISGFEIVSQESKLDYAQTLTKQLNKIKSSDYIKSVIDTRDLRGIADALYSNAILTTHFVKHIKTLYEQVKDVDYLNIGNLDGDKTSDIANKIRTIKQLSSIIDFISELDYIKPDRAGGDTNKLNTISTINEYIDSLKKDYDSIQDILDKAKNLSSRYLHGVIISHTTNPKWKSKFQAIKEKYDDKGIRIDQDGVSVKMTIEEEIEQFTRLLTENEAMSWTILNMDSVFDTTTTIIDTVLKQYFVERGSKQRKVKDRLLKSNALLKEMFGVGLDEARKLSNSNKITVEFRSKYVNDKGYLVDEIDWPAVYQDIDDAKFKQDEIHDKYFSNLAKLKQYSKEILNSTGTTKNRLKAERARLLNENNKLKETNKVIEWFKENSEGTYESLLLSAKEVNEIDELRKMYSEKSLFHKELNKRRIRIINNFGEDVYIKIKPSSNYQSSKYKNLSLEQREYLKRYKELIHETIDTAYPYDNIADGFLPYATVGDVQNTLAEMAGWRPINHEKLDKIFNEEFYYEMDKPMMTMKRPGFTISIRRQYFNETIEEYEKNIITEINSKYKFKKPFTTLEDVRKYNEEMNIKNEDFFNKHRDYNPASILSQFIRQTTEREYNKRFENTIMLLIDQLAQPEYQELTKTARGRVVDKLWNNIVDKKQYITTKGTDTTGYKRLIEWLPAYYGISNISNKGDQIMNVARNMTSFTFMGMNVLGGIKNYAKGFHDEIMEAIGGEFIDAKSLKEATAEYNKSIVAMIADRGDDFSTNLTSAIIKSQADLLELRDVDGKIINSQQRVQAKLKMLYDASFFAMNATEHFMQYTMMLAMMRTHRVIDGKIMSFNQFSNDNRENTLLSVLNDEQKKSYLEFKDKAIARRSKPNDDYDYVTRWTDKVGKEGYITVDQLKKFNELTRANEKEIRKNFEKHGNVYSQLELRDGYAEIKKDSNMTEGEYQLFGAKVQKVNQKLHGVYNRVDRMALRNSTFMNLAFQFRSWVKPNWDRFMGKRWNRSIYSEGLGTYQKGAYVSLIDYLWTPVRANKSYGKDDRTTLQAFTNILQDYGNFLLNARMHFRRLSPHERANVMRAISNMTMIIGSTLLIRFLYNLSSPFEDEEKIIQNKMLAFTLYELNMIHSEITQFIPFYGWHGFYTRTKQYPLAAEKVIYDAYKLSTGLIQYPFQDDEQRVYQRGAYKDRIKVEVQATKLIPIYRQMHKWEQLGMYAGWYRLYNPFSSFFESKEKSE